MCFLRGDLWRRARPCTADGGSEELGGLWGATVSADSSPPQPGTRVLRLERRSRRQDRPGQNTVREAFSGVAHLTPSETQTSLGFLALSSNGLCSILGQIIEVVCLLFPGWRAHQRGSGGGGGRGPAEESTGRRLYGGPRGDVGLGQEGGTLASKSAHLLQTRVGAPVFLGLVAS